MSKLSTPADFEEAEQNSTASRLFKTLPYVVILLLTLAGVAYTSINRKPLIYYWDVVAVLTGVLCVVTGWSRVGKEKRVRLIWTQALHWGAFLGAMNLLLYSDVQQMLNADSTGLATLLLLALGTFVAGVHTLSWQTGVLGVVMALSVPAIAWIEESALVLVLAAAFLVVLGGLFWFFERRPSAAAERV